MSARNSSIDGKREPLAAVPCNVLTGFLGAGKTSAILHLLAQKPAQERWAVLVNEFGEVGIDGSLLEGQASAASGVYVREVPGGCMCCAAGLPMQIALVQLLRRARPARLLIEPTGLGHPLEVLQTLASEHNRSVLQLQNTLTLVDARNVSDPRYRAHPTFVQQLEVADVVVANKADLYGPGDVDRLEAFVAKHCAASVELLVTSRGEVALDVLDGAPSRHYAPARLPTDLAERPLAGDLPLPASGIVSARNSGEGFESIGWRFSPRRVFDRDRLFSFLSGLRAERMKAVFITESGIFGYNLTRDALTEVALDECAESRIEIIAEQVDADWEETLTACLRSDT